MRGKGPQGPVAPGSRCPDMHNMLQIKTQGGDCRPQTVGSSWCPFFKSQFPNSYARWSLYTLPLCTMPCANFAQTGQGQEATSQNKLLKIVYNLEKGPAQHHPKYRHPTTFSWLATQQSPSTQEITGHSHLQTSRPLANSTSPLKLQKTERAVHSNTVLHLWALGVLLHRPVQRRTFWIVKSYWF